VKRLDPETVRRAVPAAARPLVEALLEAGETGGEALFLVGGPVRDLLLGRLLRDVDLLLLPGARDALALARAALPKDVRLVGHARFGTVRIEGAAAVVDLATARRETYPRPGALPEVEAAGLEEDLRRRDFTVNGLAVPLTTAARKGRPALVDVADGRADLAARTLRVFHARSFHDDPTRALRAARLGPRLGFRLARGTRSSLRSALRDGAFGAVSGERLHAELAKLFADPALGLDPSRALRALSEWHVLGALEPGLELPRPAVAPLRGLGRFVADPPWLPRGGGGVARPWIAGLMVWLAPLPAPLRRRTLRRLAVRGDVAKRIRAFPRARDTWLRALARSRGRGAADAVLAGTEEDELLALAAWAPSGIRRRIVRYAREDRCVRLPVGGDDLVEIGLSGPAVGRALARIRAAYLDRAVRDRDEALALARELAERGRGRRGDRRGSA
jgi:tRNA nucleotidyltransferase (CCA-adding enzyme)